MQYRNIADMYVEMQNDDLDSLLVNGDCQISAITLETSDGNSIKFVPTEVSGLLHLTNRRKQKIQITIEEEFQCQQSSKQ